MPQTEPAFPTVSYRLPLFFQTTQIDRGALCLKKISPVNQCIMDVEQISWAAIPDNQEQIIRYAVLHRINVVYKYALLLIQACTRLLLFATSAGGLPDSVKWSIRAWHIILCRFPGASDFLFLNDKMSSIFRWKDWSTGWSYVCFRGHSKNLRSQNLESAS